MHSIQTMKLFKRPLFVLYSMHSITAVQALMNGPQEFTSNGLSQSSLMGEGIDIDEYLAEKADKVKEAVLRKKLFCELFLFYIFRKYEQAAENIKQLQSLAAKNPFAPSADLINEQFYIGLLACAMQREEGRREGSSVESVTIWRDMSAEVMKGFRNWQGHGSSWNFDHKIDLLMAEQGYADGDNDTAAATYDAAIKRASEHCDILVEALACERACIFHKERGDLQEAKIYSKKATWLYNDWEATAKGKDAASVVFSA